MKYGISLKIDVSKIDKSRLFKGEKGTYLDLTTFIDTENESQYGDHGPINQSKNKDEDIQMPYIGNATIFWTKESDNQPQQQNPQNNRQQGNGQDDQDQTPF